VQTGAASPAAPVQKTTPPTKKLKDYRQRVAGRQGRAQRACITLACLPGPAACLLFCWGLLCFALGWRGGKNGDAAAFFRFSSAITGRGKKTIRQKYDFGFCVPLKKVSLGRFHLLQSYYFLMESTQQTTTDGTETATFTPVPQILERLTEALDVSINQLARSIGDKPDKFYRMQSSGIKPSYDTMQSILTRYPQVSGEFLLGQTEQVFRQPKAIQQTVEPEEETEPTHSKEDDTFVLTIRLLERELKARNKRIEELERQLAAQ
jgi:hypothetical protein